MTRETVVPIEIQCEEGVSHPTYSTEDAVGADVRASNKEAIVIAPNESKLIPTGIRVAIPKGYEIQVRPRSGLALKHQITVLNTPGTIDPDYRGEIGVILINHGKNPFVVEPGMRIAQFVVAEYKTASWIDQNDLVLSGRGASGFGHTGLH